jgi:undecaprenyl diphosphate synthase
MNLLRHYVKREAKSLHERKVRMRFIGNRQSLAEDIQADLAYVENLTRDNSRLEIVMALSYGARQEIAQAVKTLVQRALNGELTPENIDEHTIESALDTAGMNDPDLLIRTGGEQRLSNFLLWQSAYTELYFTNTLWPDFNAAALDAAIDDFSQRERRFGQRKEA